MLHDLAVDCDLVAGAEPRDAGEVLHVAQANDATLQVALRRAHADRAGEVPVLLQRGLRCAVGPDDAVDAEVQIIRLIAKISAVRGTRGAVGETLTEAVVPELPDEAALQSVEALDRVPVVGEAAVAVAHRVRVLAHDEGHLGRFLPLGPADDVGDLRVHRAEHIGGRLRAVPVEEDRTFVVQWPARVVAADPCRQRVVRSAVPRLVAERPHDDARMVLVALHHPRATVDPHVHVLRVVAEAEDVRVGLDVRLVDDVEAELVAQVVEARVVGHVRGAHHVESELLHQHEVIAHLFERDHPTGVRVEVVTVHAAQQDRLAVDEEVATPDLDPPEPDRDRRSVVQVAFGIEQRDLQLIPVGLLGRPRHDVGDLRVQAHGMTAKPICAA